jgi:osmotically-inducible protein OsmY
VKSDVDAMVAVKAISTDVYTKAEVDVYNSGVSTALNNRAVKTEVNAALLLKANSADVYTKSEVDTTNISVGDALNNRAIKTEVNTALNLKANSADVYTKAEDNANLLAIGDALNDKAEKTVMTTALNLKANSADVYTKTEVDLTTVSIGTALNNRAVKTEVADSLNLKENKYTVIDPLEKVINLSDGQFQLRLSDAYLSGNLTAANVYTKAEMDTTFAAVSASLGQKALLTDVNLQNEFRIYSSSQSNALTIKTNAYDGFKLTFDPDVMTSCLTMNNCQGSGGGFRAVAAQEGLEASVGLYKHSDLRATEAGDYWVSGLNSWARIGYTIGTTVTGACLNISDDGVVEVPFYITTQEVMVDTLRARTAEFITIDDNVTITGSLTVNGYVESGATVDHNPFWLAGKVASNGTRLSTRGRNQFTSVRNSAGNYTISTTDAFSDTNYIINITCQVDGGTAYARININAMTTSAFTIITYVNGTTTDVIFHFTAIN